MSIGVEVKRDIEKALRLFNKTIQLEGIQNELKQRRFYEKPSMKKKSKRLEAIQRRHKFKR